MNALADLVGSPAVQPAGSPEVPEVPALADAPQTPDIPEAPLRVLRGIKNGQIPGATIPEGAPPGKSGLTPEGLTQLGIDIYRPSSKGLAGVVFAPPLNAGGGASATAFTTAISRAATGHASRNPRVGTLWAGSRILVMTSCQQGRPSSSILSGRRPSCSATS